MWQILRGVTLVAGLTKMLEVSITKVPLLILLLTEIGLLAERIQEHFLMQVMQETTELALGMELILSDYLVDLLPGKMVQKPQLLGLAQLGLSL